MFRLFGDGSFCYYKIILFCWFLSFRISCLVGIGEVFVVIILVWCVEEFKIIYFVDIFENVVDDFKVKMWFGYKLRYKVYSKG